MSHFLLMLLLLFLPVLPSMWKKDFTKNGITNIIKDYNENVSSIFIWFHHNFLSVFACVWVRNWVEHSLNKKEEWEKHNTIKVNIIHVFALFYLLFVVDLVSFISFIHFGQCWSALLMYWNSWIGFNCRFFKKSRINKRRWRKKNHTSIPYVYEK